MAERVCIVTGGGQGIGRAFVKHFAAKGDRVVIADFNAEKGTEVAAEIEAAGGQVRFIETDVTRSDSVGEMVSSVVDTYGRIDILINNVRRTATTQSPIEEITDDEWQQTLQTNVSGAFYCARAVVPVMREAGWGRIINLSSATFLQPPRRRKYSHYITTKAALIGFTRALARELGSDGITVNAILPGAVKTEIQRPGFDFNDATAKEIQSIPRVEVPDDLVGTAYFLASDDSAFITGQSIPVDGGSVFV